MTALKQNLRLHINMSSGEMMPDSKGMRLDFGKCLFIASEKYSELEGIHMYGVQSEGTAYVHEGSGAQAL